MSALRVTLRDLETAILQTAMENGAAQTHRATFIGLPDAPGFVERRLGLAFSPAERQLASRTMDALADRELLVRTYTDPSQPDNWFSAGPRTAEAIDSGLVDDLDTALSRIDESLPTLRAGAWSALRSGGPDLPRHVGQSARELVDQTLRGGAPDAEVRGRPWFKPDSNANQGITRRHRARFLLEARNAKEDQELQDAACDLLVANHKELAAISHATTPVSYSRCEAALDTMESALRSILLGGAPAA